MTAGDIIGIYITLFLFLLVVAILGLGKILDWWEAEKSEKND